MEKTRLEIQDHGVMLGDYFGGTSGVMLPISIDNKTTVKDIIDQLESEINMVWDLIEGTAEYHGFSGDLEYAINTEIQAIKDFNKDKMDCIHNPDLEFDFNDIEENELEYQEYPILILTIEFLED